MKLHLLTLQDFSWLDICLPKFDYQATEYKYACLLIQTAREIIILKILYGMSIAAPSQFSYIAVSHDCSALDAQNKSCNELISLKYIHGQLKNTFKMTHQMHA